MKASILPPIPHLDLAEGRPYHLTLVHLTGDPRYVEFYRNEREKGSYIILDNGAHEFQSGEGPNYLLKKAWEMNANEIVCPDFLFDADQTVSLAEKSLPVFAGEMGIQTKYFTGARSQRFKIMLVPQGKNYFSWRRCLHHLIELYKENRFILPAVIGVSKDYEMFDGGLHRLISNDVLPLARELALEVHLLGWGRDMGALPLISRDYGSWIRSVDSAKPIVFATAGIEITDLFEVPVYPKRPEGYFDRSLSPGEILLARRNTDVFDRACEGRR